MIRRPPRSTRTDTLFPYTTLFRRLVFRSMLKIRGTEIRQELASLARIALGPYAQPFVSEALDEDYQGAPIGPDYAAGIAAHYFNERKLSIFAGSNEVQREIITKVSLEL